MGYRDQGFYRRKFPRRWFKRVVGVLFQGEYEVAMSNEVGEGGMSIVMSRALEKGTEIVINFQILGGDFVSLRADVKSARAVDTGYLHGVAFKNVPFTHRRQIRTFVSSRESSDSLVG